MERQTHNLPLSKYRVLPGLKGLYLHILLRETGRNLVAVFIPIYVYQMTGSLLWPFLAYAYYNLIVVLTSLWAPRLIRKIGLDWSGVVGAVSRSLTLGCFIFAKDTTLLLLGFTFWGVMIPFTWVPHHFTILKADDGDMKFGKESSLVMIFQRLAQSAAPVVGGLVLILFGFSQLYTLSLVFVLLSALPLFFDKIDERSMHWSLPQLKSDFLDKKYRSLNLGFIGEGLEELIPFWPIFIFLYVGQVYKVGFITGLALFLAVVALLFLGKYTDRKGKHWASRVFLLLIGVWLVKPFFSNSLGFTVVDSIYYILSSLVIMVFNSYMYEFSILKHRLEFLIRREILIHTGGVIGCLLMALGVYFGFWLAGFLLAALGVWLMREAVFNSYSDKEE